MPLYAMHALHFVASCDACGARSRLLCGRELPSARREAVAELASMGWTHAAAPSERSETRGWVEAEGAGAWRCPACGSVDPTMSKLFMLAGGIVEPGGGHAGTVSAYVVYSAGQASRLFKIKGPSATPEILELPAATTIDLGRFRSELTQDLAPALDELRALGGAANVAEPSSAWVCGVVRDHLKKTEGLEVV